MILHPEVQTRAQDQLDAVVGPDRLPQLSDRPSLPYVHAVVKELLRWHNVLPLGLPHSAAKEDEYRGWRIPSGATVLINSWFDLIFAEMSVCYHSMSLCRGILHDPEVYTRPEAFIPDRYLKDGKMDLDAFDPATIAFGSGRRCVLQPSHDAVCSMHRPELIMRHTLLLGCARGSISQKSRCSSTLRQCCIR